MDLEPLDRLVREADPVRGVRVPVGASAEARWRFVQVTAQRPSRSRRRRIVLPTAVVVAVATIVAVALVEVVPGPGSGSQTAAAAVLDQAAANVAQEASDLGPGQYLFTETQSEIRETVYKPAANGTVMTVAAVAQFGRTEETWVDASGKGRTVWVGGALQYPSPADQQVFGSQGPQWAMSLGLVLGPNTSGGGSSSTAQTPYDGSGLPTSPSALAAALPRIQFAGSASSVPTSGPEAIFERAALLLAGPTTGLTPSLSAALLQVMASQPGVELLGRVTDHEGRQGIGVALPAANGPGVNELVIDPSSGAVLESRFAVPPAPPVPTSCIETAAGQDCSSQVLVSSLDSSPVWTDVVASGVVTSEDSTLPVTTTGPLTAALVPGTPTGLTATSAASRMNLSWTAPVSDGGPITDYLVREYEGPSTSGGVWFFDTGSAAARFTIAPTTPGAGGAINGGSDMPGQVYTFTVEAVNADGYGLPSASVTVTAS